MKTGVGNPNGSITLPLRPLRVIERILEKAELLKAVKRYLACARIELHLTHHL